MKHDISTHSSEEHPVAVAGIALLTLGMCFWVFVVLLLIGQ